MKYYLKSFDKILLSFEMIRELGEIKVNILDINGEFKYLLPLDLELTNDGLIKWLYRRIIPKNRAYVVNFLAKLGLNHRDLIGIIRDSKLLSLNDCFFVVEDNFNGLFEDYNLYENNFSNVLALIVFTGYGSYLKSTFRSSPEFTTNGMLAKCWRRINGEVYLFKSGTEGFANSGNEPYSEYYASQIGLTMGIDIIPYNLAKWKGKLCSYSKLFTSLNYSFIPIGRIIKDCNMDKVINYYKTLGPIFYDSLIDMIVFDAIILNTDRHFGNFGLLIDNKTNKIIKPAPLFDHGLSLLNFAMADDLKNYNKYIKTLLPSCYNDFILEAKLYITKRQKDMLKKLINFKLKKHSRYNLDKYRLNILENIIKERINILLNI